MTYLLSDEELIALISFHGIFPGSISPYVIDGESKKLKTLSSLEKTGLVEHSHNEFYLSEDGRIIAELLAAPGICVKFSKKTDNAEVTVFADNHAEPKVWCACIRTSEPSVNVLKIFISKDSVVNFLRKEVFVLKTEFNEEENVDISLTYEEWITFGLTQMNYMRRQSSGESYFDSENEYLSDSDIYNEKFLAFLVQGSKFDANCFSSQEKRLRIYESLCKKGVLVKNEEDETYKYSDNAKIWLDNDVAYDSISVEYANTEGASYSLVLTLRINGVTSMHETDEGVRIVSSKSVPFAAYLS
ncbi:MAG: hypothetical protein IJP09_01080 [Clostridia bacterium]|nr:hypothetical protein [Clostridia bacterium]